MRLVGIASIGLFLVAVSVFVIYDELAERLEQGRHLARTRHIE